MAVIQHQRTPPRAIKTRDEGLALISRVNRWMIAGALGLSGVLSLVAAHAFHGHTVATSASQSASSSAVQQQPTSDGGAGLQAPSQVPASAPPAPAPVVSGGS